jgi:hypothetical protein
MAAMGQKHVSPFYHTSAEGGNRMVIVDWASLTADLTLKFCAKFGG